MPTQNLHNWIQELKPSKWRSLSSNAVYVGSVCGYTLQTVVSSILVSWAAVILIRIFGATKSEAGILLGLGAVLGSVPGIILGGILADRLGSSDPRWKGWVPAHALTVSLPILIALILATSLTQTIVLISAGGFFLAVAIAPTIGIVQSSVKPNERATASAILLLFANLFGLGLGPLAAGLLSDSLEPAYGVRALVLSLAALSLVLLPSIFAYIWTAQQLKDSGTDEFVSST